MADEPASGPAGGGSGHAAAELARFLRQRSELGVGAGLPLPSLDSGTALRHLGAFRTQGVADHGAPPPSSGKAGPVRPAPGVPSAPSASPGSPPDIAPPTETGDPRASATLDELQAICRGCVRCGLSETRTQVVFSDGAREARLMVVGEAPGQNEDESGVPFVGAAGKLLDLLLLSVGLSRSESVYICNVIKCRPPGNRNPRPEEIAACSPFLLRQIELVRPEAILAVGTFAGRLLTGEEAALGTLRGRVHRYHDTPLVVTYHPAALLRNSGWTRATWEDLQLLRAVMAGEDLAT